MFASCAKKPGIAGKNSVTASPSSSLLTSSQQCQSEHQASGNRAAGTAESRAIVTHFSNFIQNSKQFVQSSQEENKNLKG